MDARHLPDSILIVDFGSQVTQLIARRVREAGVYSEIAPFTLAEEAFGDKDKANRWLRRPLTELHGESPLDIAQTEAGVRAIETILGKIAWRAAA